ncbi:hypothetical protein GLAREA_00140 [Glarea lozoyensis ATCC 20868]|uniref:Heterokaryon incompatibility domain-containing protein n=1 Tax=Glarea lozoyensis (strain ATCC 20868 / MF5171) TaxID=1116229 RepID=S3CR94_GLAL2|nr:uncharacterized protein GLAREA_00140 [Glarea lozoyensis ATCC 20868]EPE28982.1 hypothetical protein GLAREA_00140 [Glarea lozoyensis ATCC 20868]
MALPSNKIGQPTFTDAYHSCTYCKRLVIDLHNASFPTFDIQNERYSVHRQDFTSGDILEATIKGCPIFEHVLERRKEQNEKFLTSNDSQAEKVGMEDLHLIHDTDKETFAYLISKAKISSRTKHALDLTHIKLDWHWADDVSKTENLKTGWGLQFTLFDYTVDAEEGMIEFHTIMPLLSSSNNLLGNAAGTYVFKRPRYPYVFSAATVGIIRTGIEDCQNHTGCGSPRPGETSHHKPSRVLFIGSTNEDIRLVPCAQATSYVALSYCWGGDESMKLTTDNLTAWKQAIPHSDLPKTIQHAIHTTRSVGKPHIWIDRLCIIQDDQADLLKELAVMGDIYDNAFFTLQAASASSSKDGFVQTRDDALKLASKTRVAVKYRCPDGTTGAVGLVTPDRAKREEIPDTQAIDSRAWTMQEQMLSTRSLSFCSNMLLWRCPSASWSHEYSDVEPDKDVREQDRDTRVWKSPALWNSVVESYSKRILGRAQDKLVALSAIAGEAARLYTEQGVVVPRYLAGVWYHQLPGALYWKVVSKRNERPSVYRAPSWSWASIDGEVSFFMNHGTIRANAKIMEDSITLKYPSAPFGEVDAGYLVVRGYTHSMRLGKGKSAFRNNLETFLISLDAIESDLRTNDDWSRDVVLLHIGERQNNSELDFVGLVLVSSYFYLTKEETKERDANEFAFRRMGCYFTMGRAGKGGIDELEDWVMRDVKII